MYYSNNLMTEENNLAVGRILGTFKPRLFSGYALSFLELAKTLEEHDQPIHSPKGILVYGDWLPEELRKELEELYMAPVYDFCSHSENTVMICEKLPGRMIIIENYFYPELIEVDEQNSAYELVALVFIIMPCPLSGTVLVMLCR